MGNTAKITPRQTRFVAEYLKDLNATQAAIRAGYSPKTAQEQGSRLLSNVIVAAAVQNRMNKRAERTQIDEDKVLEWIGDTAERCRNLKVVRDKKGKPVLVPTDEICPICEGERTLEIGEAIRRDCPACNASGKVLTAAVVSFEPFAVLKAAELAGKHLKMFTEKIEVGMSNDLIARINAGISRQPGR